jgi:NitT/TauT family transport system substrate-binding protein
MTLRQTRRRFLTILSMAGAAGLLRPPRALAAEGALETTTIRLQTPGLCAAPVYLAEALLRAEGFTDIRYDDSSDVGAIAPVARGKVDFAPIYASQSVRAIDAGERITLLAGVMVGCFELFAREGIDSVAELKGRSIGVGAAASLSQQLVTLMAAQVGLDPVNDVHWITDSKVKPFDLFSEGKIDAFLAYPPDSQELRARHVGHVIVNSGVDRPWSQYFCCMIAGNPDYVRAYPTATKRVLRAILNATDLCATEPARVARQLDDGGFTPRYDFALQTLNDNPYKWRDYDAEDTIRWYALRLHEVGLIKSSPQKIIADGTNWRFLDEIKRELKA